MKAPYKWILDYVKTDVPAETMAEKMVMTGNGVEDIEDLSVGMEKVVVGKINEITKHPDADKLQICMIDVGGAEDLQIVTGATNVFVGALVPVAMHGSLLPTGTKITRGKLRGVLSEGMLCSGEELKETAYPGSDVYGIMILREDWAPGTDMREVLMRRDKVIEFEVGANRPDCLSMIGVAREAAAALDAPIELPVPAFAEAGGDISEIVKVDVKEPALCPRYMARAVRNVKIAPSPRWMVERLRAAGIRSINNLVDITNFVMIETGQPMHAFDSRYIRGGHIIVRRAEENEKLVTLDGKERDLTTSMLMITDEEGPIGLAGIMGGENSEIREDTATVVFESAKFAYGNIRQSSRTLGLATESSMRYSKGVDAANCEYALHRACQLVEMLGAGEIVGGEIDICAEDLSERTITTTAAKINGLLGTQIDAEEMKKVLERAFIKTQTDGEKLMCTVPSFRGDMDGYADVAEEVARIWGYDNIPEGSVAGRQMRLRDIGLDAKLDMLRMYFGISGYFECVTYSFTGEAALDKLGLAADDPLRLAVRIKNPMGEDAALMRTTLIPDILDVMAMNMNRKRRDIQIYELNKVFLPKALPLTTELPVERTHVTFAISDGDFYDLKGMLEKLLKLTHIEDFDIVAGGPEYFHPGRKAMLSIGGEPVGAFGQIHPDIAANFGISVPVYVAELDIETLLDHAQGLMRFKALPKFPAIERDIAVTVDKETECRTLTRIITANGGKYIESAKLFDVYSGAQVGPGKKSMAFALTFRSLDRTLCDDDIASDIDAIVTALKAEAGADLRS